MGVKNDWVVLKSAFDKYVAGVNDVESFVIIAMNGEFSLKKLKHLSALELFILLFDIYVIKEGKETSPSDYLETNFMADFRKPPFNGKNTKDGVKPEKIIKHVKKAVKKIGFNSVDELICEYKKWKSE